MTLRLWKCGFQMMCLHNTLPYELNQTSVACSKKAQAIRSRKNSAYFYQLPFSDPTVEDLHALGCHSGENEWFIFSS